MDACPGTVGHLTWKKTWQLPVAYACPGHQRFLREACPVPHPGRPGTGMLIPFPSATALHPAQCRLPRQPESKAPTRPACGNRLDQPGGHDVHRPSPAALDAQQRLLDLLSPSHPAEDAFRTFTGLRLITALVCMSWPLGRDLMDPGLATEVDGHVSRLSAGVRPKSLDKQPDSLLATAGLVTAAVTILDGPDLAGAVAGHVEASRPGRPSKSAWARLVDRHHSACSPAMSEAAEPATRSYRRTAGPHSPKAPSWAGTYRPEHVPALLVQRWHDEHLASLGYRGATTMRRAGSVLLVQWAAGGSLRDAARYLGIRTGPDQHSFGPELARWLRDHGTKDFLAALLRLAARLDDTPGLVNYQNRRQAMQGWCLDQGTWQELTSRLPPVPAPQTGPRRPQAARSIRLHLGLRHPGRAPARTPPDRGRPAGTRPQGLGRPPGRHVGQARPPLPDRPLRRTTQTPHRPRQPSSQKHRPGRTHHRRCDCDR